MEITVTASSLSALLRCSEQALSENIPRRRGGALLRHAGIDLPPAVLDAVVNATEEALTPRREAWLGRFLVLTGLDKAGKETQCFNPSRLASVKSVREFLEERGFKVFTVSLPSYETLLGSLVGAYLKRPALTSPVRIEGDLPTDLAWILWSLDRAQHNRHVSEWLAQGERNVVLAKRWTESNVVYQVALGVEAARILRFERNIVQPDYILVLDIPAWEAVERSKREGFDVDRYEQASFLERVRENYLKLAGLSVGKLIRFIEARGSPQEVNMKVLSTLADLGF
ncbi:MAG: hypothetical protein QW057_01750 [Candidatus Bathyarchaeia archaeon]